MKQTFGVAFYCRESKRTKNGSPIEMSLSINCERTFIALPRRLEPKDFARDMASKRSNPTKDFCKEYQRLVDDAIQYLLEHRMQVSPSNIKNYILNGANTSYTISTLFNDYLNLLKLKDTTICTYRKYEMSFDRFKEQVGDKEVTDITNMEIQAFIAKLHKDYNGGTVRSYALKLKSAFIFAKQNGRLNGTDPFSGIKIANPAPKIETISEEEYAKIRDARFDIPRLERVRKIFVFLCNCGLAYTDLQSLKPSDIQYIDGKMVIEKPRNKTNVTFTSVVLDDGRKFIESLNGDFSSLSISNQKLNSYLHTIGDHCGLKNEITCHRARHFYVTHLMRMGIPTQIVQKCVGHSAISMTMRYTHLVKSDVLNAFKR